MKLVYQIQIKDQYCLKEYNNLKSALIALLKDNVKPYGHNIKVLEEVEVPNYCGCCGNEDGTYTDYIPYSTIHVNALTYKEQGVDTTNYLTLKSLYQAWTEYCNGDGDNQMFGEYFYTEYGFDVYNSSCFKDNETAYLTISNYLNREI